MDPKVCTGRERSRGVQREGTERGRSHGMHREAWVPPMVYTGRGGSHLCPPGREATGRARGCSVSSAHALPWDSAPSQDFLMSLNRHLCVKDRIQS